MRIVARVLGCSPSAVWNYAHGKRPIPADAAALLIRLVGSEIDMSAKEKSPTS
jgi:predicted transcriptional regulator